MVLRWWLRLLLTIEVVLLWLLARALFERGFGVVTVVACVIAAAIAWRASHALGSFVAAGWWRWRDPQRRTIEPKGSAAKALWGEFKTRMISYNLSQPFAPWVVDNAPAGAQPHSGALPILLVHGYLSNAGMWVRFRRRLLADRRGAVFHLNFDPPYASIEHFVEQLDARIESICATTGCGQVIILAHSMGGLVARAYMVKRGAARIAGLVTLGSPHHGTMLASLGLGRAVPQMQPRGGWLARLETAEEALRTRGELPPTTCIYTCNDDIVYPPESGVLPWADNHVLSGMGHVGLLFAPSVYDRTRQAISSIDEGFQAKMAENARQ
jgi:pimeloyl-ACP methyl ester carboxylesterase